VPDRSDSAPRAEQAVLIATYVVLFAASVVLNVLSLFLVPKYIDGHLGIAIVIAVLGNAALGTLGAWGTQRMTGVAVATLGWFLVFGVVTFFHPGEDVILAGSLQAAPGVVTVSTLWIFAGLAGCAAAFVPSILRSPRSRAGQASAPPSSPDVGTTPSG
jgi:hypothetical protein